MDDNTLWENMQVLFINDHDNKNKVTVMNHLLDNKLDVRINVYDSKTSQMTLDTGFRVLDPISPTMIFAASVEMLHDTHAAVEIYVHDCHNFPIYVHHYICPGVLMAICHVERGGVSS